MKKSYSFGLVAGWFALTAVVLAWCGAPTSQNDTTNSTSSTDTTNVAVSDVRLASTNYIPYSADALEEAQADGKKTAVFFHSKTCGSCRKLEENIIENEAKIPEDVVIFKADYFEEEEAVVAYKVDKYHTVTMFDEDGEQMKNAKGLFTLEDLIEGLVG